MSAEIIWNEDRVPELQDPYLTRVHQLIDGLKAMPAGYIHMGDWTDQRYRTLRPSDRSAYLKEAMANPCGTACCIAGKAGLMPAFQEQGFSWIEPDTDTGYFTVSPATFFGAVLYNAVLTGEWAMDVIHTTAQAIMVLEAFLDDIPAAWRDISKWRPPQEVEDAVCADDTAVFMPWHERFPVTDAWGLRG